MSLIINAEFKRVLSVFMLTFLIFVGFLSNLINIYVFSHRSMRKTSIFRFLLYLSLVDLLVVLICIGDWFLLYGFSIEIKLYSIITCRLMTFLINYLAELSSVLLMFISIERVYVILNKSFKSFLFKSKRKNIHVTKKVIVKKSRYRIEKLTIFIIISLFLMNLHYLIFLNLNNSSELNENDLNIKNKSYLSFKNKTFHIKNLSKLFNDTINLKDNVEKMELNLQNDYICYPSNKSIYYYFLNNIWSWIHVLVYSLIPFLTMIICSSIILINLRNRSNTSISKEIMARRSKRNRHVLNILLLSNFYFIVSTFPLCLANFKIEKEDVSFTQSFSQIIAYSNNSINFIFYLIFSDKYRNIVLNNNQIINDRSCKKEFERLNKSGRFNRKTIRTIRYVSDNNDNQFESRIEIGLDSSLVNYGTIENIDKKKNDNRYSSKLSLPSITNNFSINISNII
jgi:hypothetical protein